MMRVVRRANCTFWVPACRVHAGFCSTSPSNLPPSGVAAVSSHGRVQSKHGIVSPGYKTVAGYYATGIGGTHKFVHRLVARAFLGRPPSFEQSLVNHVDGDRSNNHVDNLQYVTHSQNALHSYAIHPLRGRGNARKIWGRASSAHSWELYASIIEAARVLSVCPKSIQACCAGRRTSAGGHCFESASPKEVDALPGEQWRSALHPVYGIPFSTWEVSNLGRVKSSFKRITWGSKDDNQYRKVGISFRGNTHHVYVHRIVARTFLGPPPDCSHEVNHKDGDRMNNCAANLEYVTRSQNVLHSYRAISSRQRCVSPRSKPVWARSIIAGSLTWYASISEASRRLGVNPGSISACCRGGVQSACGFHFSYATPHHSDRTLPGEVWREMMFDI